MKNADIIKSWLAGMPASSYNGNFRTDGNSLWSYNLKIGTTVRQCKVVADYTAKGGRFYSKTTSCHVNSAAICAHTTVEPEYFEHSGFSGNPTTNS